MTTSNRSLLSNSSSVSIPVIIVRVLCILALAELVYQIFDLLINSRDTIYLIHNGYYTYSFITTMLSIPLLIAIWKLKVWAIPILLTLTTINHLLWFSFGVWDYRMIIFPVLFLLAWFWQIAEQERQQPEVMV